MHHDLATSSALGVDPQGTNRRQLLARLAALLGAFGLAAAADHERVAVAKKKRKKKKKKKKGNGGSSSGGGGDAGGGGATGGGGGTSYTADGEESAFLGLINTYRGQRGVAPLSLQGQLGAAAEQHAQTMAAANAMYHNPDVRTYLLLFGYPAVSWGENIAQGYETANQVFEAWKRSPDHNRNMLDSAFTEIGIGRAPSTLTGWYWCTEFGRR